MKLWKLVVAAVALVSFLAKAAPDIKSIDLNDLSNTFVAKTTDFTTPANPRLVVRRAAKYTFFVVTNKEAPPASWTMSVKAKRGWNGSEVTIPRRFGPPPYSPTDWYYAVDNVTEGPTTYSFTVVVYVPTNAEVGTYEFRIEAMVAAPPTALAIPAISVTKNFPKKLVVLFNPYASGDGTYMPVQKDRQEYVENEVGRWVNGGVMVRPWRVAQFDEKTLNVLNYILDQTPGLDRTSPVQVTREISGSCNWRYWGQGILEGRWAATFPGGKSPLSWNGTDEVLKEYTKAGPPYATVKYGQCWVFANVSQSLLRCAGVPARTVSVFLTAIDNSGPPDGHIDSFFHYNGVTKTYAFDRPQTIDSWWNYHVWTEAWMARPDLTGGNGWQCIDATSQSDGPGLKKIGPAAREIIRAAAAPPVSAYDAGFMWSSALSDYRVLKESKTVPGMYAVDSVRDNDKCGFAKSVWTKELDTTDMVNIADEYRPAPRPGSGAGEASFGRVFTNSYFDVQFFAPETMAVGQDVTGVVRITNGPGSIRTFYTTFGADLHFYDGERNTILADPSWAPVTLASGESIDLTLTIPGAQIAAFMGQTEEFIRWQGAVNCDDIDVVEFFGGPGPTGSTGVTSPPITLTLSPSGPLAPGGTSTTISTYTNTTGLVLTNVNVTIACNALLSTGGQPSVTYSLPDIPPGGSPVIPSASIDAAMAIGPSDVSVALECDQVPPSTAMVNVQIKSCAGDLNGDGLVDDSDFVIFESGYELYACDNPEMDSGCPADLNGDQVVDDVDFGIFVGSYVDYFCPAPN
ncbi:MAG: transglutaminase domain-containing protein [Phycisphaerales bacterium]|nr:hypothetical protein [Planctomycetota bacterium]